MADPTIRKGSRGNAVKKAQRALRARGYEPGSIDGIFGARTERAVRFYQGDRGLDVDGIIGPRTWARLAPPTIRRNDHGDAVTLLQELLVSFGYNPGPVDGSFGPQTENAVIMFQDEFGLEPDGIVGPQTWAMLGS
ncbi:MAG: peptidoglycan-binding protein [Actinomycetota bacterium]|nr:peptidoglycan-binding protein [Actinomycetota bacterium]